MAKTVVGLFQSSTEAETIKQELVRQGFSAGDIRVVAGNQTSTSAAAPGTGTTTGDSNEIGVLSSIKSFFGSFTDAGESDRDYYSQGVTSGGAMLMATVPDNQADALADRLERYGAQDVNEENAGADASSTVRQPVVNTTAASTAATTGSAAIPVVEEELLVGKRQVRTGGVRVYSHLVETPVQENVELTEEHVRVQRNPVNRPIDPSNFEAFKEGTIELTETAEEPVISKQARVVEEVVVGKQTTEHTETIRDSVRHTEVEVENLTPGSTEQKTSTKRQSSGQ